MAYDGAFPTELWDALTGGAAPAWCSHSGDVRVWPIVADSKALGLDFGPEAPMPIETTRALVAGGVEVGAGRYVVAYNPDRPHGTTTELLQVRCVGPAEEGGVEYVGYATASKTHSIPTLAELLNAADPEGDGADPYKAAVMAAAGIDAEQWQWLVDRAEAWNAWLADHESQIGRMTGGQGPEFDALMDSMREWREAWPWQRPEDALPRVRHRIRAPRTYRIGTSLLTRKAVGAPLEETIPVRSRMDGSDGVLAEFSLSPQEGGLTKPLSPYDREVSERVADIWQEAQEAAGDGAPVPVPFTPTEIYRRQTGSRGTPTPKKVKEITASVERLRRTWATLEFSGELDPSKPVTIDGKRVRGVRRDNPMILAGNTTIILDNGIELPGWTLYEMPVLRYHDQALNQVRTFSHRTIEAIGEAVNTTNETAELRRYLLERIRRKNRTTNRRRIAYKALLNVAGKEDASKQKQARVIEKVHRILDALAKDGSIESWREYKRDGAVAGVDVFRPQ